MNNDVIIARQREKIEELEEQVRQLKKLLVPVFVTPVEWGLGWRLVDRKCWEKRLSEAGVAE